MVTHPLLTLKRLKLWKRRHVCMLHSYNLRYTALNPQGNKIHSELVICKSYPQKRLGSRLFRDRQTENHTLAQ